jgi:hypothetical protein
MHGDSVADIDMNMPRCLASATDVTVPGIWLRALIFMPCLRYCSALLIWRSAEKPVKREEGWVGCAIPRY